MRDRHPAHCAEDQVSMKLLLVASFGLDSAARQSGLRLQHTKRVIIPGCRDELVRAFHSVVGILSEGHIPGPTVAWIRHDTEDEMQQWGKLRGG